MTIPADSHDRAISGAIGEATARRKRLVRNRIQRERYGVRHKRRRREWAARLKRGEEVLCSRCGEVIGPDQHWDLDHDDAYPELESPAHRGCNRSSHMLKTSREW